MAEEEEKTEEPSARKIEKAREEGNVPKSQELSAFLILLMAFSIIFLASKLTFNSVALVFNHYMNFLDKELTISSVIALTLTLIKETTLILLPYLLAIFFIGVLSHIIQFGFLFTTKPLIPDFNRINPIKGIKNVISFQKIVKGLLDTLKVLLVFGIGFVVYLSFLKEISTVALLNIYSQLDWFFKKMLILVGVILLIFFVIAMIDLIYQRIRYKRSLRMSKTEVKDEFKQMEGDPQIKRKVRQIMMKRAMSRMMSNVPKADVVVTNPTHYAVALMYDETKHKAPVVVAKGTDLTALRIKSIAREHGIQIVENPPLARELYKLVDVDEMVPQELWQAVAEVLAFVRRSAKR